MAQVVGPRDRAAPGFVPLPSVRKDTPLTTQHVVLMLAPVLASTNYAPHYNIHIADSLP